MKKIFLTLAVLGLLVSSCDKQDEAIDTLQIQQAEEQVEEQTNSLSSKGLNPFRTLLAEKGWELDTYEKVKGNRLSTFVNVKDDYGWTLHYHTGPNKEIARAFLVSKEEGYHLTCNSPGDSAANNLILLECLYDLTAVHFPKYTENTVVELEPQPYGSKSISVNVTGGTDFYNWPDLVADSNNLLTEQEAKDYTNRYEYVVIDAEGNEKNFQSISKSHANSFIPGVYKVSVIATQPFDTSVSDEVEYVFFYEDDPANPWTSLGTDATGFFPSWAHVGQIISVESNPGLYPNYRIITSKTNGISYYNIFVRNLDISGWDHVGYETTRDKALAMFARYHYKHGAPEYLTLIGNTFNGQTNSTGYTISGDVSSLVSPGDVIEVNGVQHEVTYVNVLGGFTLIGTHDPVTYSAGTAVYLTHN